ncbi:MAG: hypothetical protein JRG80_18140 [Deltaproteobacteria bacterium]|nr:hypothetical protein [Deltaproteobacteria bacterium]
MRLRRPGGRLGRATVAGALLVAFAACSNNPYSESDDDLKVRYKTLPGPTKTLDPAVSYSALEHQITANVYETLLEYHYLSPTASISARGCSSRTTRASHSAAKAERHERSSPQTSRSS